MIGLFEFNTLEKDMTHPAQEAISPVPLATTPRSHAEQTTNLLLQNGAREELPALHRKIL